MFYPNRPMVLALTLAAIPPVSRHLRADDDGDAENPPASVVPVDIETRLGALIIRVVEHETGKPVVGGQVEYRLRFLDIDQNENPRTNAQGDVTIEYLPGAPISHLDLKVKQPGFVPYNIYWRDDRHPVDLPLYKEIRLQPATTIGGIVQDEAGQPIPGVTVRAMIPATESEVSHFYFSIGERSTDDEGRWQLDTAPKDLVSVSVGATHLDYIRNFQDASHDLDSVITMKKGLTVTGRVVDEADNPVGGAEVVLATDRWDSNPPISHTDENGAFVLKNCKAGTSAVTVHAEGYSPEIVDVDVTDQTPPVELVVKPGHTIRVKVVDPEGNPIVGAMICPDTWRGKRTIGNRSSTDAAGRFIWESAPPDEVEYHTGKEGYVYNRNLILKASDKEHVVTLRRTLAITGQVTDRESGEPIPSFLISVGRQLVGTDKVIWPVDDRLLFESSYYELTFREPADAWILKFEAEGYAPHTSREFTSQEDHPMYDVSLDAKLD